MNHSVSLNLYHHNGSRSCFKENLYGTRRRYIWDSVKSLKIITTLFNIYRFTVNVYEFVILQPMSSFATKKAVIWGFSSRNLYKHVVREGIPKSPLLLERCFYISVSYFVDRVAVNNKSWCHNDKHIEYLVPNENHTRIR